MSRNKWSVGTEKHISRQKRFLLDDKLPRHSLSLVRASQCQVATLERKTKLTESGTAPVPKVADFEEFFMIRTLSFV
uniref:Uncharacterized protein n=1 Tax=mine drainage metagenome TaxID=410659 RepID=E6QLE5_9ZZZZ